MTVGGEQFKTPVSSDAKLGAESRLRAKFGIAARFLQETGGAEFVAYARLRRMIQAPAAMRASGQA